jgi:hypothetical protein
MYQLALSIMIPIKPFAGHHFTFVLNAHTKKKTTSTP